ncbi:unnamed protein product [Larinioides sclopetarius]|uniref:Uncharacterized protein n=1 Tax=Larinioides sclopetarius TaxID=280406 RepID=A0AAV1ZLS7_9ARAC
MMVDGLLIVLGRRSSTEYGDLIEGRQTSAMYQDILRQHMIPFHTSWEEIIEYFNMTMCVCLDTYLTLDKRLAFSTKCSSTTLAGPELGPESDGERLDHFIPPNISKWLSTRNWHRYLLFRKISKTGRPDHDASKFTIPFPVYILPETVLVVFYSTFAVTKSKELQLWKRMSADTTPGL